MAQTPNFDIVGACQALRVENSDLQGVNDNYRLKRKTGMLDWLTSPENGGTNSRLINYDSNAKIAELEVFYDQRTKECETTDDCYASVCDTASTPLRKRYLFRIDNCVATKPREWSVNDLVALCKDPQKFMRERGFSDLRAAKEHLSRKMLAEVDAFKGVNNRWDGSVSAAGSSPSIDLIGTSGGQDIPLPSNFAKVMLDYQTNQLNGNPAFIGEGNFQLFWKLHGYSCCNATTPYGEANFEEEGRFYIDQIANTVLGANDILMVAPGAVKAVFFNENNLVEKMGTNTAQNQSIVIPDPDGYPFNWNFDMYWDICDKKWKSMFSLMWGVFNTFQADSFSSNAETAGSPDCNDELDGVTGVFGYSIT